MALTVNYNDEGMPDAVPTFLFDFAEEYKSNPLEACRQWYARAAVGMSVNFGLHSLLGKGESVLDTQELPGEQYVLLPEKFSGANFDAMDIVQLAIASAARYVTFPARCKDGFCLFSTQTTDFNSTKSQANRDFVGELTSVCEYHGIGLCLNFSIGYDFKSFPKTGQPSSEEENTAYQEMLLDQVHDLLVNYYPIAAINFHGIENISPEFAKELYKLARLEQPHILISCQQGLLGTEDIFLPGTELPALDAPEDVQGFVNKDTTKRVELRLDMTPNQRGYHAESAGSHLREKHIWDALTNARRSQCNLAINTALMPDGSLDLEDIEQLLAFGKKVEKNGYPG